MSPISEQKFDKCLYEAIHEEKNGNCVELEKNLLICETERIRIFLLRSFLFVMKLLLVTSLVVYVGVPVTFKYFASFRRIFVFRTMADLPAHRNYGDFEAFGLNGVRNFYLEHHGVKLGVWHILPYSLAMKGVNDSIFSESLKNAKQVVLYNHGNSGSRGTSYRLDMYRILRENFHVITYDYRGFGDSSGDSITENDVIEDGIFMAHWLHSRLTPEARFFLWGHSLGSTVALATTRALREENIIPTGLVLESSFHNGREAISSTPSCRFFSFLPWFDMCLIDPLMESEGRFSNHEYIPDVDCPILIVHSKDDNTISYKHGEKLYNEARKNRSNTQGTVEFVAFSEEYKCGHNHMSRAPNLPVIVSNFMEKAINETNRLN